MKAVVFDSPRKVRVAEVPDPVVGPEDVLIAVKAAGICGTDIHIYEGDFIADYPLILGHEFAKHDARKDWLNEDHNRTHCLVGL